MIGAAPLFYSWECAIISLLDLYSYFVALPLDLGFATFFYVSSSPDVVA